MATLIKAISTKSLDDVKFDAIKLYCEIREIEFTFDSNVFGFTDSGKPFYHEVSILINADYFKIREELKSFITCLRLNYPGTRFGMIDI